MFSIIISLLCIYLALVVYKFTYWKRKGVFQINSWSLFGILSDVFLQRQHIADKVLEICQKNYDKPYFGVYTCFIPTLVLNDVEIIKDVSIRNLDNFLEHKIFTVGSKSDIYSKNLFACLGSIWKETRPSISPAFTVKKVREMSPLIQKCSTQVLTYLKAKSNKDNIKVDVMKEISKKYMTDIIASVMFGIESNSFGDNPNEFTKNCRDVASISGLRLFSVFGYCFPETLVNFLKLGLFTESQSKFFGDIVMEIVQTRRNAETVRPDFMHFLMLAQQGSLTNEDFDNADSNEVDILSTNEEKIVKKSNHQITDDEIIAHTLLIVLAGVDTTSCSIDYLTYELAYNMDIQEKLVKEIDEVMGDQNELNASHLTEMTYLETVILETLRKWPPLAVTDRVSVVPCTINHEGEEIKLEKGSVVWLPIFAIHRNPKYWEDPDKFIPSRFSKENIGNINKSAYMPFGIGPKVCLGQRVAMFALKMLIVNILRSYKLILDERTPDPTVMHKKFIFLTPSQPMVLGFQRR